MLNRDFIEYLALIPKDENLITSTAKPLNEKPSKRIFKFLSKVPFSIVFQSDTLSDIAKYYELKNDPAFRKTKYVGSDYERYTNNDLFIDTDYKFNKKRELTSKENSLSRSSRLLKRDMKKCSINIRKMTFEEALKYKVIF